MTMTLADLRRRAGLSQVEVAQRMGISNAQVSRIESSYPNVMFPSLRRYMDALDTKICFVGLAEDWESDDIEQDPARAATREARRNDPKRRGAAAH